MYTKERKKKNKGDIRITKSESRNSAPPVSHHVPSVNAMDLPPHNDPLGNPGGKMAVIESFIAAFHCPWPVVNPFGCMTGVPFCCPL